MSNSTHRKRAVQRISVWTLTGDPPPPSTYSRIVVLWEPVTDELHDDGWGDKNKDGVTILAIAEGWVRYQNDPNWGWRLGRGWAHWPRRRTFPQHARGTTPTKPMPSTSLLNIFPSFFPKLTCQPLSLCQEHQLQRYITTRDLQNVQGRLKLIMQ